MKKFLSLATAVTMALSGFSLNTFASDVSDATFDYGNGIEVTVTGNFSYEKKQMIADYLVYGSENANSARGILCIFGHKLESSYSTITHHNAYTDSPKCNVYTYETIACSRSSCDYVESKELISTTRIATCHG
ncbi:MAG: hypothetical protein IKT65_03555 [Clostridia bacterium]|nr:hypothetical protein [Clostridia bacterium]